MNRCELSIVEATPDQDDDEDHDSLESKLIVRLHCKHGNNHTSFLSAFLVSTEI